MACFFSIVFLSFKKALPYFYVRFKKRQKESFLRMLSHTDISEGSNKDFGFLQKFFPKITFPQKTLI